MNNKYTFGRDTYIYNEKDGIKISKYKVIAPPQSQKELVGKEYIMTPKSSLIILTIRRSSIKWDEMLCLTN